MLDFLKKKTEITTTQIVDEIEAAVLEHVKPYGFKKHGRTLHRFVSQDISQVIHFQSGMPTDGMNLKRRRKNTTTCMSVLFAHDWESLVAKKKRGMIFTRKQTRS